MRAKLNAFLSDHAELRRLWNSLSLILGRVSSSGLGFITTMLTARLYAPAEVGISSGIVSAMMLCVQIALLGVGAAAAVGVATYASKESHATHSVQTVNHEIKLDGNAVTNAVKSNLIYNQNRNALVTGVH